SFVSAASDKHAIPEPTLTPVARALLVGHGWPGNVGELQNAAERFALGLDLAISPALATAGIAADDLPLNEQVDAYERSLIARELLNPHQSLREVAEALQLPRSEEHTSELQSRENLVCRLLLEKKKKRQIQLISY